MGKFQLDANKMVNKMKQLMIPDSAEKASLRYGGAGRAQTAARNSGDVLGYNDATKAIQGRDTFDKAYDYAAAVPRYLTPRGADGSIDAMKGLKRAGTIAGGSFLAGSTMRTFGGEGSPFSDQRGNFDIAGIPFL